MLRLPAQVVREAVSLLGSDYLLGCRERWLCRGLIVRGVDELRSVCTFFKESLAEGDRPTFFGEPYADGEALFTPRYFVRVPSSSSLDVEDAVEALIEFQRRPVRAGRAVGRWGFEIRLGPGDFSWSDGLETLLLESHSLTLRGCGPQTRLFGVRIRVGCLFRIKNLTLRNRNGSGLDVLSGPDIKAVVEMSDCVISDCFGSGVFVWGKGVSVDLENCLILRNYCCGISMHEGAAVDISGDASRIWSNRQGIKVDNGACLRVLDLGELPPLTTEEAGRRVYSGGRSCPLFSGAHPNAEGDVVETGAGASVLFDPSYDW